MTPLYSRPCNLHPRFMTCAFHFALREGGRGAALADVNRGGHRRAVVNIQSGGVRSGTVDEYPVRWSRGPGPHLRGRTKRLRSSQGLRSKVCITYLCSPKRRWRGDSRSICNRFKYKAYKSAYKVKPASVAQWESVGSLGRPVVRARFEPLRALAICSRQG